MSQSNLTKYNSIIAIYRIFGFSFYKKIIAKRLSLYHQPNNYPLIKKHFLSLNPYFVNTIQTTHERKTKQPKPETRPE